jgi:1-deoxy-D-xylulose-5-phosphate synthase
MIVMAPADENECRQMLYTGTTLESPSAIRYPRGCGPGVPVVAEMTALPVGVAQLRREGRSGLAILAFGALVDSAQKIAERLDATIVNMRFVKPLDEKMIVSIAARHRALITIEENAIMSARNCRIAAADPAYRHTRPIHRARHARDLSCPRGTRFGGA